MTEPADLRADALVMEARLLRWREEAKSDFGREMAEDAARIVRRLREALACRVAADCVLAALPDCVAAAILSEDEDRC